MKGTVKNWFSNIGYGFIVADGQDYFCHYTALAIESDRPDGKKDLMPGRSVEFIPELTKKGWKARDVRYS